MAFIVFCFVVTMATLGLQVDASCSNKVILEKLDLVDKATGKVIHWLPLQAQKNLNIEYAVKVLQTLNSNSYSATIRFKASVKHQFGTTSVKVGCPIGPSCEFRQMSCRQIQGYLSIPSPVCPWPSGVTTGVYSITKPIGDLTSHIQPSWLKHFVKTIEIQTYVDIWDDKTSEQLACIKKSIYFYKDY